MYCNCSGVSCSSTQFYHMDNKGNGKWTIHYSTWTIHYVLAMPILDEAKERRKVYTDLFLQKYAQLAVAKFASH